MNPETSIDRSMQLAEEFKMSLSEQDRILLASANEKQRNSMENNTAVVLTPEESAIQ
ncbi:MAG TPA: hypothetical protein PKD34_03115 [Candidatus Doudnabacteria bacterium]|nr:hypothetical protein [Candidatus Doudnabacteria bacterium]